MVLSVFHPLWVPLKSRVADRGGWRQRLAAETATRSRSPPRMCKAVLHHLSDWGLGISSSVHVWSHMNTLIQDGFDHPGIRRMQQVATERSSASHAHPGIMRLVEDTLKFRDLVHRIDRGPVTSVVHPSVVFGWLHKQNREQFRVTFGANKEKLRKFWTTLFSTPDGRELKAAHPYLRDRDPGTLETTFPIVLHEDAGPYSKRHSCLITSWSSLLGTGTELECKMVHHTQVKITEDPDAATDAWDLFF